MADNLLPEGFEDLLPFHAYWGVGTTQERRDRREAATMAEIMAFYEVMLAHAPAAMTHLESCSLAAMPPAEARLYEMVLMLAHVSMATELHRSPRAPNTPYPHGVRLVQAPALFG